MHSSKNSVFFTKEDFGRVKQCPAALVERLSLMADMARFNTLATIIQARSGHIGASLSAMEVFTVLYHHAMRVEPGNPTKPGRDVFILSKGHAAAGIYAVLASAGFFPEEKLLTFRRFNGLQGHVDISVPGIDGNTGSLGMGLSKAKGYAWAMKSDKSGANAYAMVGDGELQEGQNWEAIQSAAHMGLDNLYLIVDRNMVQTDREVCRILDLLSVEDKLRAFGWEVVAIDGNDVQQVAGALDKLKKITGRPKAIISNTLKGKGISFMEHPAALAKDGIYKWHGSVSSKEDYNKAYDELAARIGQKAKSIGVTLEIPKPDFPDSPSSSFKGASLKPAFSDSLVELGAKHKNLVVLDGDLADDCGLTAFERKYPERFIEVGIAEQDMVSMAGGLALSGKLPVVGTYTAFLTSRSNEQIFNNCTEKKKVIYIGHLAGLLPAKPGKSHQGMRDISLLRSMPGLVLCQPCNSVELKQIMELLVSGIETSVYMRLEHAPPRNDVPLPAGYKTSLGKGAVLADGKDVAIIGYGPLMLSEALLARDELAKRNMSVRVINLPWLNNIDPAWLMDALKGVKNVFCLENHSASGGQAEEISRLLSESHSERPRLNRIGMEGFGQSGDNEDILRNYSLDHASIAQRIIAEMGK